MKKLFYLMLWLALPFGALAQSANLHSRLMWLDYEPAKADTYGAFRGKIVLESAAEVALELSGASWYGVWVDGEFYTDGPDRYTATHPEYQLRTLTLPAGEHVFAIQLHHEGVITRILYDIQPFLYFRATVDGAEIPVSWTCTLLDGYTPRKRRINPQLGWIEWADTRRLPENWQSPTFDDSSWTEPVYVKRDIGAFKASFLAPVRQFPVQGRVMAQGELAEVFGYPGDNPGASFFLRDLDTHRYPAQGIWRRYDLGRVRLFRPKFVLDLPAGTVVEFAYSEFLSSGRVAPWITLSDGDSYNLDRYIARGGPQEFFPLTPKGGRFVEVHIFAPETAVRFLDETFLERGYYDQVEANFNTDDELLNRIWQTGIETYKACSEDALVDNPTRERGQWMGDVGLVGMEIGAVGFSDLAIIKRGLIQVAECANEEGLVAGLCPGGEAYMASYALQWVASCMNYWKLTGDKSLLTDLYGAVKRNVAAFEPYMTPEGISKTCPYWNFIDWGYVSNDGPSDMALNLHYMIAVQTLTRWAGEIGQPADQRYYAAKAADFRGILDRYYAELHYDWDKVGYHRTVLGLCADLVPDDHKAAACESIKKHILNCFPNNPDAPRLSDPGANNPQLITPYFAHYAFPVLIANGDMDFVLDQYRTCWGWALEDGRTTWVEVFDTRWTHCHQWAGSPTWQMSRYLLGLSPRFDRKAGSYDLTLCPGSLGQASGSLPTPDGGKIDIRWTRTDNTVQYELTTSDPIEIHVDGRKKPYTIKANHPTTIRVDVPL